MKLMGATEGTPARAHGLDLGALADVLGYHVAQAAVTTTGTFNRHIGERFALRKVEFSLLMLLLANGPLTPKQLARELALSAPALTLLLDTLQARGLLTRERNQADRRSQFITLTEEGRTLAQASQAACLPMERELLDRLSVAERAILIELLRKLNGDRG